jgi:hypothetical protein
MKTLRLHKFRPFAKFEQLSAQTLRNFEQKAAQSLGAAGCGVGGAARAPAGLETSAVVTRSGSRGGAEPIETASLGRSAAAGGRPTGSRAGAARAARGGDYYLINGRPPDECAVFGHHHPHRRPHFAYVPCRCPDTIAGGLTGASQRRPAVSLALSGSC